VPQIFFDRTFANGMYDSVICAEDSDFQAEEVQTQGVREPFARYAVEDAQNLLDTCKLWGVPQLPASVDAPVVSDIPTLVLNGRFDPITPPSNGAEAAKTLSRSYVYTFGFTGHGAATAGDCPESIVAQFVDDPLREPDSSCVAKQPAPDLISPASFRFAPALSALLTAEDPGQLATLLVPLACLLFLLTLFLVWPLGWLVRVLGRRPAQPVPAAAHVGRVAGALAPTLGLVFVVGLVVVVVQLAREGRDVLLLYGLPRATGWLLDIPWALAGLAAVMVVASAFAWVRGVWSVPGRVYYTLLAIAAVGLAATTLPLVR
jgi:hypothetical protein